VPALEQLENALLVRTCYLASEFGQVTNRNYMFDVYADLPPARYCNYAVIVRMGKIEFNVVRDF
jgi:hypothetical protein